MFDYDAVHWTTFFVAAFLLNLSPGPDIAFILGHTVKGGKASGFAAMFGIWAGAGAHILFATLGLTAIIAASAFAFSAVKWMGVIYLCYLGLQALLRPGDGFLNDAAMPSASSWQIFRQGMLIDILNPKVAIFFLAFLPQFVVAGAGPVWAQFLLHGVLIIVVAGVVEVPLVLLGDKITGKLRESAVFARWLDRTLGALFIALGARLALSDP